MNVATPRTPRRLYAMAALLAMVLGVCACGGGGDGAAPTVATNGYPHASEPIGTLREVYDGVLQPDLAVNTFRNMDRLLPTRRVAAGGTAFPLPRAPVPLDQVNFLSNGSTVDLQTYLALNRVAGLLVLKNGRIVNETYRYGNSDRTRWMSMSVAKSILSTLVGAAVKEGAIASIDDPVVKYVPRLAATAFDGVTVRNLLMMASGARWNEAYSDPSSDRRQLLDLQIAQRPGAAMDLIARLPREAAPGSRHNYSGADAHVLGEVLAAATKKPLATYLSDKLWSRYAMEADANWWLLSPDGMEYAAGGINATLRDFGRFGQFILDDGMIGGERVLPEGWVAQAGSPKVLGDGTAIDYGYLWYMAQGSSRADGAFVAVGINGQYIYVNRKERVVIVVLGAQPQPSGGGLVSTTAFFDAVAAALR